MTTLSILSYLSRAYHANPEAEVSGVELQRELGLDAATVQACCGRTGPSGSGGVGSPAQ